MDANSHTIILIVEKSLDSTSIDICLIVESPILDQYRYLPLLVLILAYFHIFGSCYFSNKWLFSCHMGLDWEWLECSSPWIQKTCILGQFLYSHYISAPLINFILIIFDGQGEKDVHVLYFLKSYTHILFCFALVFVNTVSKALLCLI